MRTIDAVIWIAAAFYTASWIFGVRLYSRTPNGVAKGTMVTTILFLLALIGVPWFSLPEVHLLWIFPLAILIGGCSLTFPFTILLFPAELLFWLISPVPDDARNWK